MKKNALLALCAPLGYMMPYLWGQTYQPHEVFIMIGLYFTMFGFFSFVDYLGSKRVNS